MNLRNMRLNDVLNLTMGGLGVFIDTVTVLGSCKIHTVRDVLNLESKSYLQTIPGVGILSYRKIIRSLDVCGLRIGMDFDELREMVLRQEEISRDLIVCCRMGLVRLAQIALDNRAIIDFKDEEGVTPLDVAIESKNVELIRMLINLSE